MEQIYKKFMDNLKSPIFIVDLEGTYTYCNKLFAETYNKSVEDVIGKKIEDVVFPAAVKNCTLHLEEAIKQDETMIVELYQHNGYTQNCLVPIKDDDGKTIALGGLIGLHTNSGMMKEKDHIIEMQRVLTEQIIDLLPGTIFYKDISSRYVYANKECRDIYKMQGVDNIIGKTDDEIIEDKDRVEHYKNGDEYIFSTKNTIHDEVLVRGLNNEDRWNEVIKVPVLDKYGNVTGIVGRCLDITERKKDQKRLEYLSYTDILTGINNRTYFELRQKHFGDEKFLPLGVIMGDVNGLKIVNDTFGHLEGDRLLKNIAEVLSNVLGDKGELFRFGGDEFVMLLPNSSRAACEQIISDIINSCNNYNSVYSMNISLGSAIKTDMDKGIYDILKEAEDKAYRQKLLQSKGVKGAILNSLKIGLSVRSGETEHHAMRVAESAIKVGKALNLEMSQLDELKIAADLHDIGKIGIQEDILEKPSKLTFVEYEVMKSHSEKGYRIIRASSELRNVAESVLYHHERWDGNGYPVGLKGEEIPLLSRIISVCDAYDVMTSERVYKSRNSEIDAILELKKCAGTQFDPNIVDIFIDSVINN